MELNSLPIATTIESSDYVMEFNSNNGARRISVFNFMNSKLAYSSKTLGSGNPPITINSTDQPNATISYATMTKVNRLRTFTLQIGSLSLSAGKNKIATLSSADDKPAAATFIYAVGTVGADNGVGAVVRLQISPSSGDIIVISDQAVTGTLRISFTYISVTE